MSEKPHIEIVKIQVPLMTGDPMRPALIYAKGRKRLQQCQLDAATTKEMNGSLKAYFEAEFINGKWRVGKRVKDQTW